MSVSLSCVCVCVCVCVFAPLQAPESYKNVTDVVDTCEGPIECAIKFACTDDCVHPFPNLSLLL